MTQQKDESFRVIDRRPFTAEGELRQEVVEQEREEEKAAAAAKKSPTGAKAAKDAGSATPAAEPPKRSPSFERLVESLANNAALFLGAVADPRTGQPMLDLDGAREMIDMLDALHEKTRGNLTPEEEQMLLELSGSLKLTYLELSKAATGKREKAQGKA